MKKKNYLLLLFIIANLFLKGQENNYVAVSKEDAAKIFQKINQWYINTMSYSFLVTHATYAGHKSTNPYEQKKGYFKKFNEGFHSNIADIQTIQNKNYLITIDSVKKIILINNPLKNFEVNNSISVADYQKLLTKCSSIKMLNGKNKILKIDFNKNYPISSYEICLNKEDLLQSITVYYANEVKLKTGEMVKPKLSIVFDSYNEKITPTKDELNENRFFLTSNTAGFELKSPYVGYTLLDQRVKNTKP